MDKAKFIALYRVDFPAHLRFTFAELFPGQSFANNIGIEVMADALMSCTPQDASRLMLNLPPRNLKSFCTSIVWPLFMIARHPGLRIVVVAGTRELASEFQGLRDKLLASPRYRQVFPHMKPKVSGDKLVFANGGQLAQTTPGESQIGRGADILIIDDPVSPAHAKDKKHRDFINDWYASDIAPRLNSTMASVVIVMQRLHSDDLCGHLLRKEKKSWRQVSLAAIASKTEAWSLSDGRILTRQAHDPLNPAREGREALLAKMKEVGPLNFLAQYLQAPVQDPRARDNKILFTSPREFAGLPSGDPCRRGGFYIVSRNDDIMDVYFGIPHPYVPTGLAKITDEEWEADTIREQAMLIADNRRGA